MVRNAQTRHAALKRKDKKVTITFFIFFTKRFACQICYTAPENLEKSYFGTFGLKNLKFCFLCTIIRNLSLLELKMFKSLAMLYKAKPH